MTLLAKSENCAYPLFASTVAHIKFGKDGEPPSDTTFKVVAGLLARTYMQYLTGWSKYLACVESVWKSTRRLQPCHRRHPTPSEREA